MGKDFENPWGLKTPKGVTKMMSQLLNSAVFPGQQGGPLEHVIAAKAVAFGEALQPEFKEWAKQVQKNVFDNNGIGIYMPRFEKSRLFDYTVNKGRLPKKAFSIGEESTKKYYMEAKRIK